MNVKILSLIITVAVSHSAFAAAVTFAHGKIHVPLPARFTVLQQDERLIATFGEGGSHRLEMTLIRVFDDANSSDTGYEFVYQQGLLQDGTTVQSDRILFMARDRQIDGEDFRIMHWQIGMRGCVLEMSVTHPVPVSQEHYSTLVADLNTILKGVKCAVP